MKLLQQTGWSFLGFSLLLLLMGGAALYHGLAFLLDQELDESLRHTRELLVQELRQRDSLPTSLAVMDEVIDLIPIAQVSAYERFGDTLRWVHEAEDQTGEWERFRQYTFDTQLQGQGYRISLHHTKFETEYLLTSISLMVSGFCLVAVLLLNLFNRYLSQQVWRPFYHTIEQVRGFDVSKQQPLHGVPTHIEEFRTLDQALGRMTRKLQADFDALRQFTDNASHEMQTPLAVIRSQVELLQQQPLPTDHVLVPLQHIHQASLKLARLNQALLLLTRIDNRQFPIQEGVTLAALLSQRLAAMHLLIEAKALQVATDLAPVMVRLHPDLAEALLNNLLGNAIQHNHHGGHIELSLTTEALQIRNTGHPPLVPTERFFERFYKGDAASGSLGLGLAIVHQICEQVQWSLHYRYVNQRHEVEVRFGD